jgi:hypothetical protein
MAELAFLNSRAFTKRTGGPQRSPRQRQGGGRVLSVGTLVVGGVACHLGTHGGGCSVPSYGMGRPPGACNGLTGSLSALI